MRFFVLYLILSFFSWQVVALQDPIIIAQHEFDVRVLLDERSTHSVGRRGNSWEFECAADLLVSDCASKCRAERVPSSSNKKAYCSFSFKKKHFFFQNKKLALSCIKICSKDPHKPIYYKNNAYAGDFYLVHTQDSIFLINSVDLEDYIFSVLRWESWPGWPLEVNKAFAIVCRTYVIKRILDGRKSKNISRPGYYDIKATNAHQTYKGAHNFTDLAQALKETDGLILAYNNEPILAMYDSCCGGVVPADISGVVDFVKAPYLARDYPCTHCRSCKLYRWTLSYPKHDFQHLLSRSENENIIFDSIRVTEKDKAGLVSAVHIQNKEKKYVYSGKQMYSIFKDIKSFCYSIMQEKDSIVFKGRGYGHHIGLCQWGARDMVRQGWNYKAILRYYYPGTSFMKLELV